MLNLPLCSTRTAFAAKLFLSFLALALALAFVPFASVEAMADQDVDTQGLAVEEEENYADEENEYLDDEEDRESLGLENSWRYSDGELLTHKDGVSTDDEYSGDMLSDIAAVTTKDGNKVFDWFDTFSNGYYTGTTAYKGIDVSHHDGNINWSKVKAAGVDYAIIRCGYGENSSSQDDRQWLNNVKGCLANGIPFGVYIYSYATTTSKASSEADHVLRCLSNAGISVSDLAYPIYFDMEDTSTIGSDYAAIATTFCNKIIAAGGTPGIYSSTSWFNNKLTASCFSNWTKWVAQWNVSKGLTYSGLADFTSGNGMWQFSDCGEVPGISSEVDLNYTFMEPATVSTVDDVYATPSKPYERTINDGTYLVGSALADSMVLDVASGSTESGANIQLYVSNTTDAQKFTFEYDSSTGYYSITNLKSGKALGLRSSIAENSRWYTSVIQLDKDSSDNSQKWIVTKDGDGKLIIASAINPAYVLDVAGGQTSNGTDVQIYKSNGTSAQKWTLKERYCLDESGHTLKGFQTIDGKTYYFKSDTGAMLFGWQKIYGEYYYFKSDTGVRMTGLQRIYGNYYLLDEDTGKRLTGWHEVALPNSSEDGKTGLCYFKSDTGAMLFGLKRIYGEAYYLDPDTGERLCGWQTVNGYLRYFKSDTGARLTGLQKIYGTYYYLDPTTGILTTGWQTIGEAKYYFDEGDGHMLTGWQNISGSYYCFRDSGELVEGIDAIMGESKTTVSQMVAHYRKMVGSSAYPSDVYSDKGAATITEFCNLLMEEANAEGVKAEALYVQIMIETNYLRFGGDVDVSQCNFGGLGATGGGESGLTFADVRTGLRVQVQHLKAYASVEPLNNECVDPRFSLVERGCAPTLYDLSGKWAASSTYGDDLVETLKSLLSV